MRGIVAFIRGVYFSLAALISEISRSGAQYDALLKRINTDPGRPVPNPTDAFWQQNPPFPELVDIQSAAFPDTADIVIIGSGITGASIARVLLRQCARLGITKRIVMLEARQITSGATGRNGGHIKTAPYELFSSLKPKYGVERAKAIVEFQMRHLPILVELAEVEGWESAEARYVETVDLFVDEGAWQESKQMVKALRIGMPEAAQEVTIWEAAEAREEFKTGPHVLGAVAYTSGAVFPYRLVTSVLSALLGSYAKSFSIETNTPVDSVVIGSDTVRPYIIHTGRGNINASHVIHATNSQAAGLIPGLVGKIFPVRGQMTAQRPGQSFPKYDGTRSWSIIDDRGFEYVIQRPGIPDGGLAKDGGEIMLGGGLFHAGMDEIGVANDADVNFYVGCHLGGELPGVFGPEHWGADHPSGRIKSMWTGIMGFTIDALPFVGKLESSITKRKVPTGTKAHDSSTTGMPGPAEWIGAGYNGEGMVNAWLCGVAVAMKVLGLDDVHFDAESGIPSGKVSDWLPEEYIISSHRLSRASIAELATLL